MMTTLGRGWLSHRLLVSFCTTSLGVACNARSTAERGHTAGDAGETGACEPVALPLDAATSPRILGVAGAPLSLFGAEEDPEFAVAFDMLQSNGIEAFFPWFGISEVDGVAEISGHFDYWLPFGSRSCEQQNPYAAAAGRIGIIFPAFLFSDAAGNDALSADVFVDQFALHRDVCWGGNDDVIVAYESFDEIASQSVINGYFGEDGPLLQNAPQAAALLHELSDKPVLLVEGPLPTFLAAEPSLSDAEVEQLITEFWSAVEATVDGADMFGFDVYPVPDLPLTVSAEYVGQADLHAPESERVAVLQAFSYDAQSAGSDPRRGPTASESRFMAFDAIVSGASHLIWYGASALDLQADQDREVWEGVLATIGDIARLQGALDGDRLQGVQSSPGTAVAGFALDGGALLVWLNRSHMVTMATLTLPAGLRGVVDEGTNSPLVRDGDRYSARLEPWEVRILLASDVCN